MSESNEPEEVLVLEAGDEPPLKYSDDSEPPAVVDDAALLAQFRLAQSRMVLQSNDLGLATLAQLVDSGSIDVAPKFQRRDRWNPSKQSALIESFLLNLPIPPVYLAEEGGRYAVIDGRQRLTAIREFFNDSLTLTGTQEMLGLRGHTFSTLPQQMRDGLSMRPLRTVTLLGQTDPESKYLVFHRLNTAGEVLNQQEIRNVVYRGPLNDLLFELAESPFLRDQLKIRDDDSAAYRKMQDVEFVLRFLTLRESWSDFSGNLSWSMDDFMERHQRATSGMLKSFRKSFLDAVRDVEVLWGEHAFRRPEGDGWRAQTLAGLYDAQMVVVAELSNSDRTGLGPLTAEVVEATRTLFEDEDFDLAVRSGTNTPARIRTRIDMLRQSLQAVLARSIQS